MQDKEPASWIGPVLLWSLSAVLGTSRFLPPFESSPVIKFALANPLILTKISADRFYI